MSLPSYKVLGSILLMLVLAGTGCLSTERSSLSPEEASQALTLTQGSKLVIQPTVLGLGGSLVDWFGGEEAERTVLLNEWNAGESAHLEWSYETSVETEASIKARWVYETQYAESPIGAEIPDPPETEYETKNIQGSLSSSALATAESLLLPRRWEEGDMGEVDSTLIWLTPTQYEELVTTRSTKLNLGLFDESLMNLEETTESIDQLIEQVVDYFGSLAGAEEQAEKIAESIEDKNFGQIEAEVQWGDYSLLVNGVRTKVQVISAKNAFAQYKILANPENPLILEVQLTPFSQGQLNILGKSVLPEVFAGYEIIEITNEKTGE